MRITRSGPEAPPTPFTEERIQAEGQKDGERNLPEMGSYMSAPFEQALISHGEQDVQEIYKQASARIALLQPVFQAFMRRLEDIERRIQPITEGYKTRTQELGRDVTIPFPAALHWALIIFLGIGEFPLNTVVFRLFGEAEYLTYVMASTLAIMIPLIGVFIGMHLRHALPRMAGNILIGALTPISVGGALFAVSLLRNIYIGSQFAPGAASARTKLFQIAPKINGEIQAAKSQVEQVRAMTNQRVALYRQTNIRFRKLLPPYSFRRPPEFPKVNWWPEVSVNGENGASHDR